MTERKAGQADTVPASSPPQPPATLSAATAGVLQLLRRNRPRNRKGVPEELHPDPPFVPKSVFMHLGDLVKAAERPPGPRVPGERWISLRLDGRGFGRFVRALQAAGALGTSNGYSPEFAELMQESLLRLMNEFNAACGYTQSDEMTVLISATRVVRGAQQPHAYNGRVQKIGSLAASVVTSVFNFRLVELCQRKKVALRGPEMLGLFDCRVGSYASRDEALSVVLWRAYDCGVNGVSDAVHKLKGDAPVVEGCEGSEGAKLETKSISRKKAILMDTNKKLLWLKERGMLPLPDHQATGSFYRKVLGEKTAFNKQLKKEVTCLRSVVEKVKGNVLELARDGNLLPEISADEKKE